MKGVTHGHAAGKWQRQDQDSRVQIADSRGPRLLLVGSPGSSLDVPSAGCVITQATEPWRLYGRDPCQLRGLGVLCAHP